MLTAVTVPPAYDVHPPQQRMKQLYELPNPPNAHLYPSLTDFMGLEITPEMLSSNNLAVVQSHSVIFRMLVARNCLIVLYVCLKGTVAVAPSAPPANYGLGMVAPLSGQSSGLVRAQVSHGIRELVLCKGSDGKIGLRCQVNKIL